MKIFLEDIKKNETRDYFYLLAVNILKTHNLNDKDIDYAVNFILNSYFEGKTISKENLIKFLVYSNKTTICKFCLSFNEQLDLKIKNRENILDIDVEFLELEDNSILTLEEIEEIRKILLNESKNIEEGLKIYLNNIDIISKEFLYSNCLEENLFKEIYLDKNEGYSDIIELLDDLTEENRINKITGRLFSENFIDEIYSKYIKEIKLLLKYKNPENFCLIDSTISQYF